MFILSVLDSEELMDKMLKENPHGLVKFQVYSTKEETTYEDRRLNRVKTKNAIPFGPWAKMIVESNFHFYSYYVQYHIIYLIDAPFIVKNKGATIKYVHRAMSKCTGGGVE